MLRTSSIATTAALLGPAIGVTAPDTVRMDIEPVEAGVHGFTPSF